MVSLVQAGVANGANPASSIAAAFGSNVTAGSRIVVGVRIGAAVALTSGMVTDTIGNTYSLDFEFASSAGDMAFYSAPSPAGGANTVTFNPASSARIGIGIWEFSGLDAYGGQANGANGTSTTPDSGNLTPAAATGVIIAIYTGSNAITWEADYATGAIASAVTGRIAIAYDLAPPASAQSASGTITSAAWNCTAAWYPDAAGGGGGDTNAILLGGDLLNGGLLFGRLIQ